jgi:hypothetical protein
MFAVDNSTGSLDSFGGIVSLGVGDMAMVTFPRGMVLFLARMDKAFMPDEKIAAGEGLTTQVAYKGLLLGVSADVSLKMFLHKVSIISTRASLSRIAEDGTWARWMVEDWTYKPGEESLAVRTWQRLGLVA